MTDKDRWVDRFDAISPLTFRYADEDVDAYLSENAFVRYKLAVERALVRVLARKRICSVKVAHQVERACGKVRTYDVYNEEDRIHHDIRALVNCIRDGVSDEAKPFVHMMLTSYDVVETANAARYRDVVNGVVIPVLESLQGTLIVLCEREAGTPQVGRTHGQHAVPITFGFSMAYYVSRLGNSIEQLRTLAAKLPGKISGAVGAYNASSLFFDDPEAFEAEVLAEMGIPAAECSTQVAPSEATVRLLCEMGIVAGILGNLADDMRNLQRTEIGEVGEEFKKDQVGSSTMPQKRNPVGFEFVKSVFKIVVPRLTTAFLDLISEHQRDLTNSASSRTYGEIIAYVVVMAKRMNAVMKKLTVDAGNMERNLAITMGMIIAEPLYILLAALGHPDAHEKVRVLTLQAQREKKSLQEVAFADPEIVPYLERMSERQRGILANPERYTGIAAAKARNIAEKWATVLTR